MIEKRLSFHVDISRGSKNLKKSSSRIGATWLVGFIRGRGKDTYNRLAGIME